MKNKNSEQSNNLKLKSFINLSLSFNIVIFAFLLLFCCLSVSIAHAETSPEQLNPIDFLKSGIVKMPNKSNTPKIHIQAAKLQPTRQMQPHTINITPVNFAAQIGPNSIHQDYDVAEDQNSSIARQLWDTAIAAPKDKESKAAKDDIQGIIKQLESIEFKTQTDRPAITIDSTQTNEPKDASATPPLSQTQQPVEQESVEQEQVIEEKIVKIELPYIPVADKTLQILEELSQNSDQLDNSFELAEILYLSGNLKQAAVLYQHTLSRKTSKDAESAWIMFQIGNCLKEYDKQQAVKIYEQLTEEYPGSPWVDLAQSQNKIIEWYQENKPEILVIGKQP